MDDFERIMVVFFIGAFLFMALIIIVVSTQVQVHSNFCETKLVYSNNEHWCLNEDDGKLYAFACDGDVRFDGLPASCYYKSNLVKEVS